MNKKLKYGSFAVALTVAVLAVIIIINALFTGIAQKKSLYLDMTKEQIYTVSPEADAIFSALSNKPIDIIFFTEPDIMMGYEYQKMIYEYALKLEDKYDYITVKSTVSRIPMPLSPICPPPFLRCIQQTLSSPTVLLSVATVWRSSIPLTQRRIRYLPSMKNTALLLR